MRNQNCTIGCEKQEEVVGYIESFDLTTVHLLVTYEMLNSVLGFCKLVMTICYLFQQASVDRDVCVFLTAHTLKS